MTEVDGGLEITRTLRKNEWVELRDFGKTRHLQRMDEIESHRLGQRWFTYRGNVKQRQFQRRTFMLNLIKGLRNVS